MGLGSNVGDRLANLRAAVGELRSAEGVDVVRTSSVYDTDPVGPPQANFLNAVLEIATSLVPVELVRRFKAIEQELGREPSETWGPRAIDLDLLLYGDKVIDEPSVRVPHPEMTKRAFVLIPLAEIAPDVEVPGFGSVAELSERVDAEGVRLVAEL